MLELALDLNDQGILEKNYVFFCCNIDDIQIF